MNDERLCECGRCRYCIAHTSTEYDYLTSNYLCSQCNGAGCTKCEIELAYKLINEEEL